MAENVPTTLIGEQCARCGSSVDEIGCLSSEEFCIGHPLPGREDIERGEIEDYEYEDPMGNPE
jgi:hypothetical protein